MCVREQLDKNNTKDKISEERRGEERRGEERIS
jgi:hypothetical protein